MNNFDDDVFDVSKYHTNKITEYFFKQHYFDSGYKQGISDYKEFIVNSFSDFVDNILEDEIGNKSKQMKKLLIESRDEIVRLQQENDDLMKFIEVNV
jgi:hypothetical protein